MLPSLTLKLTAYSRQEGSGLATWSLSTHRVIIGMLSTGLVFVSVIALGEAMRWLRRGRDAGH